MLPSDLLLRRKTHFTLWRPTVGGQPPTLVIGVFAAANPNILSNQIELPLTLSKPGLWEIAAGQTGLPDGVYHYWFRVEDTNPSDPTGGDPLY